MNQLTNWGGLSRAARLEAQWSRFVMQAASLAVPTSLFRVSTNVVEGLPGRRLPWVGFPQYKAVVRRELLVPLTVDRKNETLDNI